MAAVLAVLQSPGTGHANRARRDGGGGEVHLTSYAEIVSAESDTPGPATERVAGPGVERQGAKLGLHRQPRG